MATPLQALIEDYKRDHPGESYASIGRRAGLERGQVQALATRDYVRRGPEQDTVVKLAKGLEMDVGRVRDAVALSVGHGAVTHPNPDIALLLQTVEGMPAETLKAVLRRARLLRAEMDEERRDRDG